MEFEFVRMIDELGRVVVPKDSRRALGLEAGDSVRITVENDCIILKRGAEKNDKD